MQRETYMAFAVDRGGVALVADFTMNEWPDPGEGSDSFVHYSYLRDLDNAGRSYTCRLIGLLTLHMMKYAEPAFMRQHPVGDVTSAGQIVPDGSITVPVHPTSQLSTHVMLSVDVIAETLEVVQRGSDKKILPLTARAIAVAALEQGTGDDAAVLVGEIVLDTLAGIYPAIFAAYPSLAP